MPAYQFRVIERDGHVAESKVHEFPDDREALSAANQSLDGHDLEVWEGSRLIAYLVPAQKAG